MKKTLLFFLLVSASCFCCFAQAPGGTQISIGPEIGMPTGDANKVFNLVLGGSVKFEIPIKSPGLFATLTAGYVVFKVYSYYEGYIENGQYIPLEIGVKYYIPNSPVYIEGEGGLSINNNQNFSGNQIAPMFAPSIGISCLKNSIDISARLENRVENLGSVTQLSLRLAYKFGNK